MDLDWHRIFFGDQPYSFFIEILLRTLIMFIVVIVVLRLTGKRGVKQLSIFEVVMIITLGSAAGDPMLYEEVGLLHAVAVFIIVLLAYRLVILIITKNEKVEEILEGKATYIIREGKLAINDIQGDELGLDEFFAELRAEGIEHLGQVRCAILEGSGTLSTFYYSENQIRPGLPILPDEYNKKSKNIIKSGLYACAYCGDILFLEPIHEVTCQVCNKEEWVEAIDRPRVT